jgi:uncharacterized protein (TIGR02594 family)
MATGISALPKAYAWLAKEPAPKMLVVAVSLYNTAEIPGPKHSPLIMGWLDELGFSWIKDDETPWCGTAMAICAKRAGKKVNPNMPRAKWWMTYGNHVDLEDAALGDILVFDGGSRGSAAGHVGQYVAEDDDYFHVLGGNQSNRFLIARILKSRCVAVRRTPWAIAQPENISKRFVNPQGVLISNDEG